MLGFVAACGDDDGAIPTGGVDTGTITGRVVDPAGNPVPGAAIGTSPATATTFTDQNGNFTITNVPAGSVTVIANASGFAPGFAQVVVIGGQTAQVTITLTPGGGVGDTTGAVSGIVQRRTGEGVAGVTVNIVTTATGCAGTPVQTATTDAGGGFLVTGLAPGTYLACVTTTIGGRTFTGQAGFSVTPGGFQSVTITIGVETAQSTEPNVGGTPIELDANGNFAGVIQFVDIDGDGLPNADCNVIFTQHLWVVQVAQDVNLNGVADVDEPLVSGVRVEWSLNEGPGVVVPGGDGTGPIQGSTGVIVDTDDPFLDPVQAESARAASNGVSTQFKVDNTHAVTYTNDTDQTVDFNGLPVTIGAGQTWIIVSSPVEGFTDVIAFSPDLARTVQCGTDPAGNPTCPDKTFALKRWVNWRIEIGELDAVSTADGGGGADRIRPQGGGGGGGLPPRDLVANIVTDGDTVTNRLDRTPVFVTGGGASFPCAQGPPGPADPGDVCTLNNSAFFGVVISRLRQDSPFTFISGTVDFAVLDDSPDVDVDDIDSDEDPGVEPGFGGGDPSADDVETPPNDDNLATAPFAMDGPVTFECEFDPNDPDECVDVDVLNQATNSQGQTLQDMGFTITPGSEDEEGAVAITVSLDPAVFFAFVDPASPTGFTFSPEMQALIQGTADADNLFTVSVLDQFGEVCETIDIGKRWVTSVLTIFKQGPTLVQEGQQFTYIVTVVNDGEDVATDVVMADTLPLLDVATAGDRQGNQAFRYVTDAPTFDPDAIRYYVDAGNDEGGTEADFCIVAPEPGFPPEFDTPESRAQCNNSFVAFGDIDDARAAAEETSRADSVDLGEPNTGDAQPNQIVIVEYFDQDVLARTQPGGDVEAEDSFAITVEAFQSVNDFRLPGGAIPQPGDPNAQWCNVATVTSGENDFAADSVCTRAVEALLEVRKTVADAVVPAGSQTSFLIELANNGSTDLLNVTVTDTLDANLDFIMESGLCAGCTIAFNADSTIFTITVPTVPPTDVNQNGVFDPDEPGFAVATITVQTPLAEGQFCNRVTASAVTSATGGVSTDSDLSCVVTQVEIEFDIVNTDGLIVGGAFTDVETFTVGDTVAYQTLITNRSQVAATNVTVLWEIAPEAGILEFLDVQLADPAEITCDTGTDTCTVTVASLAPSASIALNYRTLAVASGNDVNRITLTANELSLPVVNEEPTTVNP